MLAHPERQGLTERCMVALLFLKADSPRGPAPGGLRAIRSGLLPPCPKALPQSNRDTCSNPTTLVRQASFCQEKSANPEPSRLEVSRLQLPQESRSVASSVICNHLACFLE